MNKILAGLADALEIAKAEKPAARVTIDGHTYVSEEEFKRFRNLVESIARMTSPYDPDRVAQFRKEWGYAADEYDDGYESIEEEIQAELGDDILCEDAGVLHSLIKDARKLVSGL